MIRGAILLVALVAASPAAETDSFVVETVMMPLRDGVRLATDIYRPARGGAAAGGTFPVLLTRSPYNKRGERGKGEFFARHGYVFVAQDCRGFHASEGEMYPLVHEGRDGYDAIEWAARQPWSNGKVATTGASYLAMDQYAALAERPPSLAAVYAAVGGTNFYADSAWRGGTPSLQWPVWIANTAASRVPALAQLLKNPDPWLRLPPQERAKVFADLPQQGKVYADFYAHPNFDEGWKQPGFYAGGAFDRMKDVPMLLVTGWYDQFADASIDLFTQLTRRHRSPAFLVIGPWPHNYGKTRCGDAEFGPGAEWNERAIQLDWFDHWLKGIPLKMTGPAPVRYFRMGGGQGRSAAAFQPGGEWRTADRWPRAAAVRFRLSGDHSLALKGQPAPQPITFVFDPNHPAPTLGGRHANGCIVDQGPPSQRPDVLSYQSAPLDESIDVTGRVSLQLKVSTDAPDTDFFARVIDVYPDGYAMNLAEGQLRLSAREGPTKRVRATPGKGYAITLDLGSTSNVIGRGHRIRVDVTSSSFPAREPNPNTFEPAGTWTRGIPAHNAIYHDRSWLDLPVVSAGAGSGKVP